MCERTCARNQKVLLLADLLNAAAGRNVRGTIEKVAEPVENTLESYIKSFIAKLNILLLSNNVVIP